MLVEYLESNGLVAQHNQLVDLYCHLRDQPGIFEVKSITATNERSQLRAGLSQLYEYRFLHNLREASLWLVLSAPPHQKVLISYLEEDRHIRLLWRMPGDDLAGPGWECLRAKVQLKGRF